MKFVCSLWVQGSVTYYAHVQVATEPDVTAEPGMATDPDWSSGPPPSSLADSVDLARGSQVHQPL